MTTTLLPTFNQIISALLSVTNFETIRSAQVVRQVNPVLNTTASFVVSDSEPTDIPLPLNVVWLCMDTTKKFYRTLLTRTSKDASTDFKHTWVEVKEVSSLWAPQFYAQEDLPSGAALPLATKDDYGVARLTTKAAAEDRPTFVSENDPRNTNARVPKDHTHPEKPAKELKHSTGKISVDADKGTNGTTFVAKDASVAEYAAIDSADLLEADNGVN